MIPYSGKESHSIIVQLELHSIQLLTASQWYLDKGLRAVDISVFGNQMIFSLSVYDYSEIVLPVPLLDKLYFVLFAFQIDRLPFVFSVVHTIDIDLVAYGCCVRVVVRHPAVSESFEIGRAHV